MQHLNRVGSILSNPLGKEGRSLSLLGNLLYVEKANEAQAGLPNFLQECGHFSSTIQGSACLKSRIETIKFPINKNPKLDNVYNIMNS